MTRQYPERPIFGVGAIIFDGPAVLLIQRGEAPLQNRWSLPGGAQELGETAEDALRREILEETGLEVEVAKFVSLIDIIERDDQGKVRHHYTVADYVCRTADTRLSPGGDARDARWVPLQELEKLDLTPRAKEVIEAAWLSLKNI